VRNLEYVDLPLTRKESTKVSLRDVEATVFGGEEDTDVHNHDARCSRLTPGVDRMMMNAEKEGTREGGITTKPRTSLRIEPARR
jgi:hypothetical protein